MEQKAVRNLRLCTKDCLCLYVCPFGATDTENSIIDTEKCNGCGLCAQACPSGAISMVPVEYPPQQPKTTEVKAILNELAGSKSNGEVMAKQIAKTTEKNGLQRLMTAIARSERLISEDLFREAGFMLPQSRNAHELLRELIENPPTSDFPSDAAKKLLELIPDNESGGKTGAEGSHKAEDKTEGKTEDKTEDKSEVKAEGTTTKWRCTVCGYIHEGDEPPEQCPVCKQPSEKFEKL